MRLKRQYSDEFIQDAVELTQKSQKSMKEVARSLGIPISTLRQWVIPRGKDVDMKSQKKVKTKDPVERENVKLKRELAETKMERDILKKAVAIFSKIQE